MKIFDIDSKFPVNHQALVKSELDTVRRAKNTSDSGWVSENDMHYAVTLKTYMDIPFEQVRSISAIRMMDETQNYEYSDSVEAYKINWEDGRIHYTIFFLKQNIC